MEFAQPDLISDFTQAGLGMKVLFKVLDGVFDAAIIMRGLR
jgi:hypothetical protein